MSENSTESRVAEARARIEEARAREVEASALEAEKRAARGPEPHGPSPAEMAMVSLLTQLERSLEVFQPIMAEKFEWGNPRAKIYKEIAQALPDNKEKRLEILFRMLKA